MYDDMVDRQDLRAGAPAPRVYTTPPSQVYAATPTNTVRVVSNQDTNKLSQDVAGMRVELNTLQDNQRKLMAQIGELQESIATRDKQIEELRGLVSVLESRAQTSDAAWQERMAKLRESMETQQKRSLDAMANQMAKQVADAVQKSPAPSGRVHVVQSGDVLSVIAAAYGVSVKDIKSLNGLKSDTIRVGQKLKIP
jgi:LysM repeat protein